MEVLGDVVAHVLIYVVPRGLLRLNTTRYKRIVWW